MRTSRYSPRTEAAYVDWIKRYIRFHGIRHPQEMGAEEVKGFLSHLATQMKVAASTQNQAFFGAPVPLSRGAQKTAFTTRGE